MDKTLSYKIILKHSYMKHCPDKLLYGQNTYIWIRNSVNKKNDASGVAFVRYLPILQSESNSQDYTNVDHSIVT